MKIDIPELSIVALIGKSDSIKADFLNRYFNKDEILSFDDFKEQIEQGESVENVEEYITERTYSDLHDAAYNRLKKAQLTVVDADNMEAKERKNIIDAAKRNHCFPVAIVFATGQQTESDYSDQVAHLEKTIGQLQKEGFRYIYLLKSEEEAYHAEVMRTKLYNNKRDIHGPFDIIGDIHGCYDELCELLLKLGYQVEKEKYTAHPPQGRKVVFVGDLADRGPKSMAVLRLVMSMVKTGEAYCTLGNHDGKLQRKLKGSNVQVAHGLETTVEEMTHESESFIEEVKAFLDGLISHYVFDDGKLVVAHAGLKEKLHGRGSRRIRDLAMFGETTGKKDKHGLPERINWAKEYGGKAFVVYGHTPQKDVKIVNNTANIDTGCVFGGKLSAIRYPEKEVIDVNAKTVYYEPSRPFL